MMTKQVTQARTENLGLYTKKELIICFYYTTLIILFCLFDQNSPFLLGHYPISCVILSKANPQIVKATIKKSPDFNNEIPA